MAEFLIFFIIQKTPSQLKKRLKLLQKSLWTGEKCLSSGHLKANQHYPDLLPKIQLLDAIIKNIDF